MRAVGLVTTPLRLEPSGANLETRHGMSDFALAKDPQAVHVLKLLHCKTILDLLLNPRSV